MLCRTRGSLLANCGVLQRVAGVLYDARVDVVLRSGDNHLLHRVLRSGVLQLGTCDHLLRT